MTPQVGVMIITMMRPELIDQCINAVLENTETIRIRLINNGDQGETHTVCQEWGHHPQVEYVYQPRQWPAQTRNDSMIWAVENNFKYLIFIDDDLVVIDKGIDTLIAAMEEDEAIFAMSGKIMQPQRRTRLVGGPLRDRMFYKLSDRPGVHETDWVGGGYTIHRLEPLLFYDDEYQTGWNDYDWSMMAKQGGHRLAVCGDAESWHAVKFTEEGMAPYVNSDKYRNLRYDPERIERMRQRFEDKWGFRLEGGAFEGPEEPVTSETLTHLTEIEVPVDKLVLGFRNMNPRPTWDVYTDTWKMVDEGETDITALPLYKLMKRHYCTKTEKRLLFERDLLGVLSHDCEVVAYAWVERHVDLYHSIKDDGFRPERRHKPISVHIQDDGSLYVADGTHTVSILMHLGTQKTVTATVRGRAPGWIQTKERFNALYRRNMFLYQPPDHPDLMDWNVDRPSPHRWNAVKQALGDDMMGLTVLDVGSFTGHFCFKLASLGARVTGIEPHILRHQLAQTLSLYHGFTGSNPRLLVESFEDNLRNNTYDVAIVLSVLHHYFRRDPQEFYDAVRLISERCDRMILGMGVNRMPIPWNPDLVLENSLYTSYTTLWDGKRPMYLYER